MKVRDRSLDDLDLTMSSDTASGTAVFIGNLKSRARIGELKSNLHILFHKTLKIPITPNDISIINGIKRYAIIDVHNKQTVEFVLENLSTFEDRTKIKYNFLNLVDPGVPLHVDTLKSQDEKQARDDFENAKNVKPYQKQNRAFKQTVLNPDYGRAVSVKSLKSSVTGRLSRNSNSTKGGKSTPSVKSTTDIATNTDLDVTIDEFLKETGRLDAGKTHNTDDGHANRPVNMVPLAVSSEKEDSDESLTRTEAYRARALSPIMDSESEGSGYEDEPGSVIDLRNVRRSAMTEPNIKSTSPRKQRNLYSRTSSGSTDFFTYLDRQMRPELSDRSSKNRTSKSKQKQKQSISFEEEEDEEGTPYYKYGERVLNDDRTKEFKHYERDGQFTLRKMREHVGRCVCGFLNSQQSGMLLIGVTDEGIVVGIECDVAQEERYRRHFEDTMKEIYPPIFSEDYYIHFAPVIGDNGRQQADLKVIEVNVEKVPNQEVLFECKEGVFVRRKGVLTGPIRPSHIQEWIKVKHFREIDEMKKTEVTMKEQLEKKDFLIRRQADTIMAQKSELDRQKHTMVARTCNIL